MTTQPVPGFTQVPLDDNSVAGVGKYCTIPPPRLPVNFLITSTAVHVASMSQTASVKLIFALTDRHFVKTVALCVELVSCRVVIF